MTEMLVSERQVLFTDDIDIESQSDATMETLSIRISEAMLPGYGSYLWPSSIVLAQYIWFHRKNIMHQKCVLEIGAGTALPSVIAIKCARPKCVIISDKSCSARDTLHLNEIDNYTDLFSPNSVTGQCASKTGPQKHDTTLNRSSEICAIYLLRLSWGEISPDLVNLEHTCSQVPEIIISSDCFYDPELFEQVICTVYYMLRCHFEKTSRKEAKFLCTYQTRSTEWDLSDLLDSWNLDCVDIPLESFKADTYDIAGSGMPGHHSIQMMEISLK